MRGRRILTAFLAAPAVMALFFFVCSAVAWIFSLQKPEWHGWPDLLQDVKSILTLLGFLWLVGAVVSAFLGAPVYVVYRRLGWRSWPAFALGGALIGSAAAIILYIIGVGTTPIFAACCTAAGLVSSLAFRAIVFGCGD